MIFFCEYVLLATTTVQGRAAHPNIIYYLCCSFSLSPLGRSLARPFVCPSFIIKIFSYLFCYRHELVAEKRERKREREGPSFYPSSSSPISSFNFPTRLLDGEKKKSFSNSKSVSCFSLSLSLSICCLLPFQVHNGKEEEEREREKEYRRRMK